MTKNAINRYENSWQGWAESIKTFEMFMKAAELIEIQEMLKQTNKFT
jgi:hypothetical protein